MVGGVGLGLMSLRDDLVHDAGKLIRVPMLPGFPPLARAWIGKQVFHGPLDFLPQRSAENAVAPVEIHPFEILEEASQESAQPDFGHRVQFTEGLEAAKINGAELRAVAKRLHQLAPLSRESVYGGVASFPGLLSDLNCEVNEGRNSDNDCR